MNVIPPPPLFATNEEVARILFHLASLLDMLEDNPYRVRAYRRAALGVLYLPKPLADYVVANEEFPIPGLGERLSSRLRDLVNTGSMGVYESLMQDLGEPLISLLTIRGVGPKTAIRLVRELGVNSLQDLVQAAKEGRVRSLRGFGPVREAQLRAQAESLLLEGAA